MQYCCNNPNYKKVSHVIFDLDGTILDTETIYFDVQTEIAEKYGKKYTKELHNQVSGRIEKDTAEITIAELDLPLSIDEFRKIYQEICLSKLTACDFMPGAENFIKHLSSNEVPIAVATSSAEDMMILKTQNHKEVFDLFHHIVCGATDPEVEHGKPAPDIFLICASRFDDNPAPSQCLVFEDAPNGVRGALSAGMQVVMLPNEHVPYEDWRIATLRLDSFEMMIPALFGLPPLPFEGDLPDIKITMPEFEPFHIGRGTDNEGAAEGPAADAAEAPPAE